MEEIFMNEEQIRNKLDSMKKLRKVLGVVTIVASLLSMAVIIAYNFMPITFLKSSLPDQIVSAANFSEGFAFPGWQVIFWGCGGQFIMQDNLFNPNPITIAGSIGTLLVLIVCTAIYNRGKNRAKAVKDFIMAACLIFSAIVLGAMIVPISVTAATSGGVYNFKNNYLLADVSTYTALPYATFTCVALIVAAAVKVANGAFLLYQRSFAQKYAPKKK